MLFSRAEFIGGRLTSPPGATLLGVVIDSSIADTPIAAVAGLACLGRPRLGMRPSAGESSLRFLSENDAATSLSIRAIFSLSCFLLVLRNFILSMECDDGTSMC